MWNRLVPHGTTENSMSVSSPEYLRADLQKLNRDMAILKKVTPTLFWTTSQMTFFDIFCRNVCLLVTCGAFLMYYGTCTQDTQLPDMNCMNQSVPCACKKR